MNIPGNIFCELIEAAKEDAPIEACGLLAGKDGEVTKFYRLTNADKSAEHYTMIPEEQFAAIKDMRKEGLKMLAVWHSHPETPARMSEEDIRLAYTPDTLYTILSLADPEQPVLKGFEMIDGKPQEAEITFTA